MWHGKDTTTLQQGAQFQCVRPFTIQSTIESTISFTDPSITPIISPFITNNVLANQFDSTESQPQYASSPPVVEDWTQSDNTSMQWSCSNWRHTLMAHMGSKSLECCWLMVKSSGVVAPYFRFVQGSSTPSPTGRPVSSPDWNSVLLQGERALGGLAELLSGSGVYRYGPVEMCSAGQRVVLVLPVDLGSGLLALDRARSHSFQWCLIIDKLSIHDNRHLIS